MIDHPFDPLPRRSRREQPELQATYYGMFVGGRPRNSVASSTTSTRTAFAETHDDRGHVRSRRGCSVTTGSCRRWATSIRTFHVPLSWAIPAPLRRDARRGWTRSPSTSTCSRRSPSSSAPTCRCSATGAHSLRCSKATRRSTGGRRALRARPPRPRRPVVRQAFGLTLEECPSRCCATITASMCTSRATRRCRRSSSTSTTIRTRS